MRDLLVLALTSHAVSGEPIRKALWRDIRDVASAGDPDALLSWAERSLKPEDFAAVQSRLALLSEAEETLSSLSEAGIGVITELDERYPTRWRERLGGAAPPLVFFAGEPALLNEPSVGIVGSRDVDDEGSAFAAEVAAEAAILGYGTVSGGARGVDQIAMKAAYEAGAGSVGIMADSLRRTIASPATREALESGKVCLCSPFSPDAGFSVGTAMGRNKLVYALSVAMVVVAAAEGTGGTWAGAVEALDKGYTQVLVRPFGPGAEKLIGLGGAPLASPSGLAEALENANQLQGTLL